MPQFDAIVVGSGISGGWAAKELTERGLKVALLERGPMVEHITGYTKELTSPWDLPFRGFGDQKMFREEYPIQMKGSGFTEWNYQFFVSDRENPYQTPKDTPFEWRRGYHLGGRSLLWGRQCYRLSELDFSANALDGVGLDWPIRYADIAPWYDYVEDFVGVSGSREGLAQLPDGNFQPPMAMNAVELALKQRVEAKYPDRRVVIGRTSNLTEPKPGRSKCQYRNICARGCSFGAYFSTQSSTLPAAQATGNLTLRTNAVVESIQYDPRTQRASGVRIRDNVTFEYETITAKMIFLCAGSVNSVSVLLRSESEEFPSGIGNSHDVLGRYFMDHALTGSVTAEIPGFDDHGYFGNRPAPIIIPRFVNLDGRNDEIKRGFSYQGMAYRRGWPKGFNKPGIGQDFKDHLHQPGPWILYLAAFAEALPRAENRITLDKRNLDRLDMSQTHIAFSYGENEKALLKQAQDEALAMAGLLDGKVLSTSCEPGTGGSAVHEMGGARMGNDPTQSVLNAHNQVHSVPNVFVTDGAAMSSTACQNPSLTYMALTARAAAYAVDQLKSGAL